MNILNVLAQNLGQGSRTRTPEDAVPYPEGYRGQIKHDTDLCIACGACAYACSPSAITLDESSKTFVLWKYTEDRCTFCGFCVQFCPTKALGFEEESPAPLTEREQHYLTHSIQLEPCQRCGEPFRIIPEGVFTRLYGDPLPEEITEARGLCERCRQRVTSVRFKKAFLGL